MTEKDRYKNLVDEVKKVVKRQGNPITNEQIADELDYSREHFQRLYTGKGVVREKHIRDLLLRFPEVQEQNITSHVLNDGAPEPYRIKRFREKNNKSGPFMVPFVPVKAQAGYVRAIDQEVYVDTLEKYALPPGVSGHGAIWRYWEVEGDSMEPVFKSGDILLTSLIHPMDWENLRNFYIYVIVTAERVLVKRIYCKNDLEWVLISENEDNYQQMLLPVESVKEVWIYRRTFSTRGEPTKRFEIKV